MNFRFPLMLILCGAAFAARADAVDTLRDFVREVKSGRAPQAHAGTAAFAAAFKVRRTLLVGGDGISVQEFLTQPVTHWLAD